MEGLMTLGKHETRVQGSDVTFPQFTDPPPSKKGPSGYWACRTECSLTTHLDGTLT